MIFVYVTYPTKDDAKVVSKALLEARLVACANIFQPHESIYWWEGKIEEAEEFAVIYKTQAAHFEALSEKITELHPYDTPCIVAFPIEQGHPDFLKWIGEETT